MHRNRTHLLFKHFLKNSPARQLSKYQEVFPGFQPDSRISHNIPSDSTYIHIFLTSLETFGTPISELKLHPINYDNLYKIFPRNRNHFRQYHSPINEVQQLQICIREMSNLARANVSDYHEIEQRLVLASPQTLRTVKIKLTYLFKLLLNRREKLGIDSLEMEANIHLSQTIIKTFTENHKFQGSRQWSHLQALDKLSRAREYKKNGYSQIASDSFAQIFKNQEVPYNTRLQALKDLCQEGEQLGDAKALEPLVSVARQTGEKEYEQYLDLIIRRIKKDESKETGNE